VFGWIQRRLWPALITGVRRWSSDNGSVHSAALAYCAAFSLFPLCLTLIALLGLVTRFSSPLQDRQRQMLGLLREHIGPWLTDQLQVILLGIKDQAAVGGPLGLLTLVVAAIGIFVQLEAMFDAIWEDPKERAHDWLATIWTIVYERMVAFLMLLGVGLLLILLFVANMILAGTKWYYIKLPVNNAAWWTVQWLIAIVGNAVLLAVIFKILPRAPVRWREALGGGFFVALVWQVGQHVLTSFVISDRYSVYGVVGSFIAVMVWFYYASAVLFLGAEVVHALASSGADSQSRGVRELPSR
jgi:membrane protein